MTINDYLKKVNELRELGQTLMEQQFDECDEPAAWVDELECMEMHLECCAKELERAGVK